MAIPNDPLIEFLNALLLCMDACMVYVFARYMVLRRKDADRNALVGAAGLTLLFVGLGVQRGLIWYMRHLGNAGVQVAWTSYRPVTIGAIVVASIGLGLCVGVFFRDWGRLGWLWMLILILLVAAALTMS